MTLPDAVVCGAIEKILEKMYFRGAESLGAGRLDSPAVVSQVTVSGDFSAAFVVKAAEGLAARLAADFIATDVAEVTASQAAEIVYEFTNVACAAAFGEWMPEAKLFFSVPHSLSESEAPEHWPYRFCIDGPDPDLAVTLLIVEP